ncbi:MAG: F0F1 ATP synthase subunit delta [Gammaproteobacteria bacterium]|nr:F0F1 ATP synthase subunit delta [Gammaproteobacteria bacterium]MCP5424627.1 F0F1 ATP synthase subunit delta [Gammaproteobacteria bacterium]MCP5460050.1 F0F1 ATP synthase subunit delta [Gammaproteobacteria bacterium]
MAEMTTVARPYARAAFEQAQASGELASWSDLLQTAAQAAADPALHALLAHPKLTPPDKAGLLLDICAAAQTEVLPDAGRNFITLLAENDRLDAIAAITEIFENLRADAEKSVHALMTAAFAVSDEQRQKITEALKQHLQRDVVLECAVDESLIGGAIIRAGDLVIDGSARGYLDKLAVALHQ